MAKVDIFTTDKKYNIIYAEPPWSYRNMGNIQATANAHYPTMRQEDIENLPIERLAEKDCILFLWATFPKIQEALDCMKAWGFEYKTVGFTWVKKNKRGGALLWCRMVHKIKRRSVPHRNQRQSTEGIKRGILHSGNSARSALQKAGCSTRQDYRVFGRYTKNRTLCAAARGRLGLLG